MKRIGNLYDQICSVENLQAADREARKGKTGRADIVAFDKKHGENLHAIHQQLINRCYKLSPYKIFSVFEPKERKVYWLCYADLVVQHAIILVIGPILTAMFTRDTYSCIKGRGIHNASFALRDILLNTPVTQYCLKLDIRQFYPSVDHHILKAMLCRKFKDADLLDLLDEIIDSAPGIPIGNYLSIYFGNFYLCYFDHHVKEKLGVKNYLRYMDDIVILADNKPYLHRILAEIRSYFWDELKLTIKGNYQVFAVADRGIDFVGYVHFHDHVLLRKSIKKRFARMLIKNPNPQSLASYMGWLKHCDSKNLIKKLLNEKIQRTGNAITLVGRQNRNKGHPKSTGSCAGLPDRPKQAGHRQALPYPAN